MPAAARNLGLCALALCLGAWLWFLDAPFSSPPGNRHGNIGDEVACFQAKVAWNFVVHPFAVHHGWPLQNEATVPAAEVRSYATHPPLWSLLLAAAQAAFGREAWACRLWPLLFGGLSLWLCWRLAQHTLAPPRAWLVLALFATLPLTLIHGTLPNYEPACQVLLLACWLLYLRDATLRGRTLLCLLGIWIVGAWTDHGGHYGPATLLVDVLLFRTDLPARRRWRLVAVGVVTGALLVTAVQAHSCLASGEAFSLQRMTGGARDVAPEWPVFVDAMATHGQSLLGSVLLAVAAAGVLLGLPGALRRGATLEAAHLRSWFAILGVGLGNCLLLRRHALQHDFWLFYSGPAVAAFAVVALRALEGWHRRVWLTVAACTLLASLGAVQGIRQRHSDLDPAACDYGIALRQCVDGDAGEVALAPFRPGSERTVGFYARALVVHFVARGDPAMETTLALHGALHQRRILVLSPAQLAEHRAYLEQQFPGVTFEACGELVSAVVPR